MSLRLRVTLVVAVVVTVVVAAVGNRVYAAAEGELVEEVDLELAERARGFEQLTRGPGFADEFNAAGLRNVDGSADERPDPRAGFGFGRVGPRSFLEEATSRETFTQVLSAGGDVVISLGPGFDTTLDLADYPATGEKGIITDGTTDTGERARVVTLGASDVFVQIARPLGEIDQSLDDLSDRIIVISLLAIVLAAGAAWWIAGSAVAPIRRLTDAAESVAATGDLDQPVDGSGGDEVGRLATSFNSMLEALSTSRRQQRRLVMDASHELRTPLASLRTNVDVLRSGREIPDDMREAIVDDIGAEIDELGDLVAELVDLATDVREDEDPAPVELAELAGPIVERQARRTDRDIDLVVVRRAVIEARPNAVSRAIRNLIENAAKFSPDGTPIRLEIDGGDLTVSDHGPGVPAAEREAVFERFHRVEATRTMPGSGLGLAIVRQVAEAHGGRAFVGDAEGGGAAVTLSLPTIDD
ncbi:MAG: HAMP domain-containing sensor histidine kinase [Actinomycetota bacterium]